MKWKKTPEWRHCSLAWARAAACEQVAHESLGQKSERTFVYLARDSKLGTLTRVRGIDTGA